MIVLIGIFEQVVFGLCECARRLASACCTTAVGGKFNEAWPQDEHYIIHATSLLKYGFVVVVVMVLVLTKPEGLQKWLAPCGTDVH
jgi:hypothetical protein